MQPFYLKWSLSTHHALIVGLMNTNFIPVCLLLKSQEFENHTFLLRRLRTLRKGEEAQGINPPAIFSTGQCIFVWRRYAFMSTGIYVSNTYPHLTFMCLSVTAKLAKKYMEQHEKVNLADNLGFHKHPVEVLAAKVGMNKIEIE